MPKPKTFKYEAEQFEFPFMKDMVVKDTSKPSIEINSTAMNSVRSQPKYKIVLKEITCERR